MQVADGMIKTKRGKERRSWVKEWRPKRWQEKQEMEGETAYDICDAWPASEHKHVHLR